MLGLKIARMYTYGTPRVGNDKFANFVERDYIDMMRISHGRDMITHLPPTLSGYIHIGKETWFS